MEKSAGSLYLVSHYFLKGDGFRSGLVKRGVSFYKVAFIWYNSINPNAGVEGGVESSFLAGGDMGWKNRIGWLPK